jgi:hypothetical protein
MRRLLILITSIIFCISTFSEVKTYTEKAITPIVDNIYYHDFEYTYNINSEGKLTGINTFSVVYQKSPPPRDLYSELHTTLRTGKETLTIVCDPRNTGNRTMTYTNTVQYWYFDRKSWTWKKRFNDRLYGEYTIKLIDWRLSGTFSIPIGEYNSTSNYTYISGTSINGEIPEGKSLLFGYIDKDTNKLEKFTDLEPLVSESNLGDFKGYIEVLDYLKLNVTDIEQFGFWKYIYCTKENMTLTRLCFPATFEMFIINKGPFAKEDFFEYVGLPKLLRLNTEYN